MTDLAEVETSERTALYRLHDAEGVLLYVGITSNPERRFAQHWRSSLLAYGLRVA